MYDVCIVGAGPAGSTLARLLPAHLRVLLLDSRAATDDSSRTAVPKTCGGLLAPPAQKELARQGLGVPADILGGPQLFAVKAWDRQAGIERLYQRHYTNTDRGAFDRWLLGQVPDNVTVEMGWRFESVTTDGESALVRMRSSRGAPVSVATRLLVGADGAASAVRRSINRPLEPARYTTVQGLFAQPHDEPHYRSLFDRTLTDFYCWTIPKREGLLVGGAFPHDSGARARYERLISLLRSAGIVAGEEVVRTAAPVVRPARPGHIEMGRGNTVLLGEAAGLISPSSAEGISFALRSAARLAESIERIEHPSQLATSTLPLYRDACLPMVFEVMGKTLKSGIIYQPAARQLVMRAGLGTIQVPVAVRQRTVAGLALD